MCGSVSPPKLWGQSREERRKETFFPGKILQNQQPPRIDILPATSKSHPRKQLKTQNSKLERAINRLFHRKQPGGYPGVNSRILFLPVPLLDSVFLLPGHSRFAGRAKTWMRFQRILTVGGLYLRLFFYGLLGFDLFGFVIRLLLWRVYRLLFPLVLGSLL